MMNYEVLCVTWLYDAEMGGGDYRCNEWIKQNVISVAYTGN